MQLVLHHTVIIPAIGIVSNLTPFLGQRLFGVIVECCDDERLTSGHQLRRVEAQMTVTLHIAHIGMVAIGNPSVEHLHHLPANGLGLGKAASRKSQAHSLLPDSLLYLPFHIYILMPTPYPVGNSG